MRKPAKIFLMLLQALVLLGTPLERAFAENSAAPSNSISAADASKLQDFSLAWRGLTSTEQSAAFASLAITLGVIVLFFSLAGRSDLLRDDRPENFGGALSPSGQALRRPYSLSQSQMAWWFVVILAAYIYLFLVTGSTTTLTLQALTLMGVGTATALGANMIEQNKAFTKLDQFKATSKVLQVTGNNDPQLPVLRAQRDAQARDLASQNFLSDILTDVNGISLHRLQSFVWTLLMGIIFLFEVIVLKKMPQFDGYVLALLGVSGGTYLGLKVNETPA